MSFCFYNHFMFLSIFCFLAFSARSSQAHDGDLIDQVCSGPVNRTLCNQVFRSDPRSAGAKLPGLALIAIDGALGIASKLVGATNQARSSEKNPVLRDRYNTCWLNFVDISDQLSRSKHLLKKKEYTDLYNNVKYFQYNCGALFGAGPPVEPEFLQEGNRSVEEYTDIVTNVAELISEANPAAF